MGQLLHRLQAHPVIAGTDNLCLLRLIERFYIQLGQGQLSVWHIEAARHASHTQGPGFVLIRVGGYQRLEFQRDLARLFALRRQQTHHPQK